MQIKLGVRVSSSDDQQVGVVSHVVIDLRTKEITHLVIQKGHLFTKDRLVPMSSVYSADENHVMLQQAANDLMQLPEFEHTQRVLSESGAQPSAPSSSVAGYSPTGSVPVVASPHYIEETIRNIPEDAIALEAGAKVIAGDGHHFGNVERVITPSAENRVTHFIIVKGLLMKSRKVIATDLVSEMLEDEIHLTVDSDFLESINVPEYQSEMQQREPS
jgi:uncharacterized protein YrrD